MHKFLIEETILFCPSENTLTNKLTNESAVISLLASDIMSMLISAQGEAISRDKLLTDLFERREASPTNHNLNQYILNLRKQLQFLGLDSVVIVTVPRVGFMIPVGVLVEKNSQEETYAKQNDFSEAEFVDVNSTNNINGTHNSSPARSKKAKLLKIWIAMMTIITLTALLFQWANDASSIPWDNNPNANPVPINDDKMCQIFVIPSGIDIQKKNIGTYKNMINEFAPLNCPEDVMTRYYIFNSAESKRKYRSFVLRCTYQNKSSPTCYSWHRMWER